jgi:hypothetical protein
VNESVRDSERIPYERTRRVLIPGIAAIVIVWLVQSALGLLNWYPGAWVFRVRIPFTRILPFIHWDLIVSFAFAGALSALYGALVKSSRKQSYIAALFPVFFEILKWVWLIHSPLAPWIDPASPPYRFARLPVVWSMHHWLIHIVIPSAAAMGVLYLFNRWFHTNRQNDVIPMLELR